MARPVLGYPTIFAEGTIWDRFPYLLPNLVCTVIVSCGVVVGILFLEETHAEKKFRHDPGLAAGKWILSKFTRCANLKAPRSEKVIDETSSLLDDEQPPGYRSSEGSPNLPSTPSPEPQESFDLNASSSSHIVTRSKPAATKAFTRQVVLNIVGYGILA